MNCPKCQSERFEEFEAEGVTTDFCRDCFCLWFDQGELAFFVEAQNDVPNLMESLSNGTETDWPCPKCEDQKLLEIPYHKDEDLLVDYCKQCHGLLLDKKEVVNVEKIVAKYGLLKVQSILKKLKDQGYKPI